MGCRGKGSVTILKEPAVCATEGPLHSHPPLNRGSSLIDRHPRRWVPTACPQRSRIGRAARTLVIPSEARNLGFAYSATTHVGTAALGCSRSVATPVWNGHCCPLPLTLTLFLIRIATRPHAAPWKSGASAPREASKTNAGFQPPRCAAPPRFCHSERAEGGRGTCCLAGGPA